MAKKKDLEKIKRSFVIFEYKKLNKRRLFIKHKRRG